MKINLKTTGLFIISLFILLLVFVWVGFNKSMQFSISRIDDNLQVLTGGGGNSIILTSEDKSQALIVDTKMFGASKKMSAMVKAKNIIIVNTHVHNDHTGGNNLFPGATVIAGAYTRDQWKALAKNSKYPDRTIQPGLDTTIKIGAETVHIYNIGQAHTWNDVVVYLENHNFLLTGDIVFHHMHPAMFIRAGSNLSSWMSAIDRLYVDYDTANVLPGHGLLSNGKALHDMKVYFQTIKASIGKPQDLTAAKIKFKDYQGIPLLTGFNNTVKFMKNEKKNNKM